MGFECFDMNSIFYGDLITEAIQSGTLLHGFNPETYQNAVRYMVDIFT